MGADIFDPLVKDKQRPAKEMVPVGIDPSWEKQGLRKQNQKTFENPTTKLRTLVVSPGNCHWLDKADGNWKEIELVFERDNDPALDGRCKTAPYDVQAFSDRVGYELTSEKGDHVRVELLEVDDQPVDLSKLTIEVIDNEWHWKNVVNNKLDCYLRLLSGKVELNKRLLGPSSPRKLKWALTRYISTPVAGTFQTDTRGKDANLHRMELLHTVEAGPTTAETETTYFTEEWTGRVSVIHARRTRRLVWSDTAAAYPAEIDADFTIQSNLDDISTTSGVNALYDGSSTSQRAFVGESGGKQYGAGARFELAIPQGAKIIDATLVMVVSSVAAPTSFHINMEKKTVPVNNDDWAATTNMPRQIDNPQRFVTSYSVAATGTKNFTGWAAILQTQVNKASWTTGDSIKFWFENDPANVNGDYFFFGNLTAGGPVGTPNKLVINYIARSQATRLGLDGGPRGLPMGTATVTAPSITGTGALTSSSVTLAGTGKITRLGTGALSVTPVTGSGAGVLTRKGTGALTSSAPTLAGAGVLTRKGTGALTSPTPTTTGAGVLTRKGTGALTGTIVTIAGVGQVSPTGTGSGALSVGVTAVSGTGTITRVGTGSLSAPITSLSGIGVLTKTGVGSLTVSVPSVFGSHGVVNPVVPKGGFSKEQIQARRELRKQLQKQYDDYIDQLVFNLAVEEPDEEITHEVASQNQDDTPIIAPNLDTIKSEVNRMVPSFGKYYPQPRSRELQMAQVIRERALRKFEEEYLAVLLLAED